MLTMMTTRAIRIMLVCVGVCLFALSGCFSYYRNVQDPRASQADYDRDLFECKQENTQPSTTVAGPLGGGGMRTDDRMVRSCMAARGWQRDRR
jgi:hypothetical protein